MPYCHRRPGGSPHRCVGRSTGGGESGPNSSILVMHVLTRRSGFSGRQAARSIRSAAHQVWLHHKDRRFPLALGTWSKRIPAISRLQARSVFQGHLITNRLGT
jgi:hypothetical protein